MKFMILMSSDPSWDNLSEDKQNQIIFKHEQFERDLESSGSFVSSARFGPDTGAAIYQDASGKQSTAPNPLTGEGEIGGYYLIDVEDMETALAWAARCRFITGANWVYPIWE
ncbi:MAG: YciI family protein [Pseudomonadales bacterium]